MATFSPAEMSRRVDFHRARMTEAGLDALILTSYQATYYLSGAPIHVFGRPSVTILAAGGTAILIAAAIEESHLAVQTWITDRRYYRDGGPIAGSPGTPRSPSESAVELLAAALLELGLGRGRVGFEEASMSCALAAAIREKSPALRLSPASSLVESMRMVKSSEELRILRAADAVADAGLRAFLEIVAPGLTALELHEQVRHAMLAAAADRAPLTPVLLRVGVGLDEPAMGAGHSEAMTFDATNVVRDGQVLDTVFDATIWGYMGNVERAVVVGIPSADVRRDYEAMIDAHERAIEAVRPGELLANVDRAAKRALASRGYETITGTGLGRGIISYEGNSRELGMDVRAYSNVVLEPGMAFSVEPRVGTPRGVFRHCNTVIVTDDGCDVDSSVRRDLIYV